MAFVAVLVHLVPGASAGQAAGGQPEAQPAPVETAAPRQPDGEPPVEQSLTAGQPPPAWEWPPEIEVPQMPEEAGVRFWPVVGALGIGGGGVFRGTIIKEAAPLMLQASGFLGILHHWRFDHGPALGLALGLPVPSRYKASAPPELPGGRQGVNFAFVPGYGLIHRVFPEFFWGAQIGLPLLVAPTFLPGLEVNATAAYRVFAGLGAYARLTFDAFFCSGSDRCYSVTTLGGEVGIMLYYEWFRPWEPPAPEVRSLPEGEVAS